MTKKKPTENWFKGEWLFDLVWVKASIPKGKNKDLWKYADGLAMACEIEWSTEENDLLEDFLKLTFANSDLKLFIYTNKIIKSQVHPVQICIEHCPLSSGYRFLLIGFPDSSTSNSKILVNTWIS